MHFEQKADFEIKPNDTLLIAKNNLQSTPASVAVANNGKISQAGLEALYGKDAAIDINNTFIIEQVRDGATIHTEEVNNAVTNVAIDDILDTYFGATVKKAGFFLGLIDSAAFTATALTDTMASHAGWAEFVTYSELVRQTWTATAASTQAITGTTVSEFTIGTVTSQSIQGLFVTDSSTKSGATGFLWSTALFSSPAPVVTGDVFRVTYTLRLGN